MYSLNEVLLEVVVGVSDAGGSIVIHVFGAYFGLVVSWIISPEDSKHHPNNTSSYNSNIFSMLGTLFLWMFWPSFNGAMAFNSNARHRAIVNTVLSLTGSCLMSYMFSSFYREGLFRMEDILNASLAGGVVMGAVSELSLFPFASILIGCAAGAISTIGFESLEPWLLEKIGLHDTAGIHNLHGMPGLMGGILSAIFISGLTQEKLGGITVESIFWGRGASVQAGYQLAGIAITLGISITSAIVVGFLLKHLYRHPKVLFQDKEFYVMEQGNPEEIEKYFNLGVGKADGISKGPSKETPGKLD